MLVGNHFKSAVFSVSSGGVRRCADSMPWVKVKARDKSQVSWLLGSLLTIRFLNEFSVKFSHAVLSHTAVECVTEKQEGERNYIYNENINIFSPREASAAGILPYLNQSTVIKT